MAIHAAFGWAFGVGLFSLGIAWVTTTGMAYYAILRRRIAIHKEWMVRAYVVTFAFVIFRILSDYGPTSRLQPDGDKSITIAWACWRLSGIYEARCIALSGGAIHRCVVQPGCGERGFVLCAGGVAGD
jgi:hypothetical protein